MNEALTDARYYLARAEIAELAVAELRERLAAYENLRAALERYADPAEWSTRRGPKGGPMIAREALDRLDQENSDA